VTWNSLRLENYRAFADLIHCDLRPLTLLFGYNSSGKSALLRSLPLLAGSLRGTGAPIELEHPAMRGGGFNDVLTRVPIRNSNRLGVAMEFSEMLQGATQNLTVRWSILEAPDLRRQIIENFEVFQTQGGQIEAILDLTSGPTQASINHQIKLNGVDIGSVDLQFQGLLPGSTLRLERGDLNTALTTLRSRLTGSATAVQWLTSVRSIPPRTQPYPGSPPSFLKPDGNNAFAALAYSDSLCAEVSAWFEKHVHQRLVVVPMADQFQVALETLLEPQVRVPIADVGEGLIQVLPVLVAAAMARQPTRNGARILAIEEPESHLHPRLHAALAERFCTLAALPEPPQIILETHSENVLLEVQIQIASGLLDPSRVVVYWVRILEDGRGRVEAITFDQYGRPVAGVALPRGVFAEDMALSKRLFEKQQEQLAK
jgi:predicted ATPase